MLYSFMFFQVNANQEPTQYHLIWVGSSIQGLECYDIGPRTQLFLGYLCVFLVSWYKVRACLGRNSVAWASTRSYASLNSWWNSSFHLSFTWDFWRNKQRFGWKGHGQLSWHVHISRRNLIKYHSHTETSISQQHV
jgi:hypothetical protein